MKDFKEREIAIKNNGVHGNAKIYVGVENGFIVMYTSTEDNIGQKFTTLVDVNYTAADMLVDALQAAMAHILEQSS